MFVPVKGAENQYIVTRVAGRWTMAIDMEVLSINPFWYRKTATRGGDVKMQNEKPAEPCAAQPERLPPCYTFVLAVP